MMMMSKCSSRRVSSMLYHHRLSSWSQTLVRHVKTCAHGSRNANSTEHCPPRRPLIVQLTHRITNQVPPLQRLDLYQSDLALQAFLTKENGGDMLDLGKEIGTYHWFEQGHQANRHTPVLHQYDRYGQRIDEVEFHPAYHDLMQLGMRYGASICRNAIDCYHRVCFR
jgi:hypothetical protein